MEFIPFKKIVLFLSQYSQLKQGTATLCMNNISKEHIKKLKFIPYRVPVCSARRVYNSFSSNSRLSPRLTEECFREFELENQSLGHGWLFKKNTEVNVLL